MSDMALDQPDPVNQALARGAAGGGGNPPPAAPPVAANDDLMRKLTDSQKRQEALLAAESREKAPVINAALAESRQPGPAAPQLQRETAPPKSNMQQQMQDWLMPMVALSAIAGAFSRQHATTALNAFSAGVQGLKEGNLTLYDQKLKEWKSANEQVLANNKAALDEYNAAWNNKKLNIDQKMNEIALIASKYQDKLTYEAAQQKNFTAVAQLLQKQENLSEKLDVQYQRLKVLSEANEAKFAAILQFKKENPNATAQQWQQFTAGTRPPRSAPAMALQKYLQEHPNATAEDIQKFYADFQGSTAYQRTAAGQAARIEVASNEVEQAIPQAIQTSRALPRGKIVPLNELVQKWQQGTSDPAYNDFIMANFALINAYTRAMNPQGVPRIAERLEQKAIGILSEATSQEAYETQVRRLWREVQGSKTAVSKTREGVTSGNINAPLPGLGAPTQAAPAAAPGGGVEHLSDDDLKKKLGIQ